jgi:hypothetical protein
VPDQPLELNLYHQSSATFPASTVILARFETIEFMLTHPRSYVSMTYSSSVFGHWLAMCESEDFHG